MILKHLFTFRDVATVGITKHATEMLGDIVFVEVPDAGKAVEKEGQAAVVELSLIHI